MQLGSSLNCRNSSLQVTFGNTVQANSKQAEASVQSVTLRQGLGVPAQPCAPKKELGPRPQLNHKKVCNSESRQIAQKLEAICQVIFHTYSCDEPALKLYMLFIDKDSCDKSAMLFTIGKKRWISCSLMKIPVTSLLYHIHQ